MEGFAFEVAGVKHLVLDVGCCVSDQILPVVGMWEWSSLHPRCCPERKDEGNDYVFH